MVAMVAMKNTLLRPVAFLILFFINLCGIFAADFQDGRIKYIIDESNGRLTLYYMTDVDAKSFEPLFWDKDKKTSFLTVSVNGTEYRLGDTTQYKMYLRGTSTKPILAFESQALSITEEFSFIRTASSGISNGIRIDIKIENWGDKKLDAGARYLFDTFLGEKTNPNFRTNARPIGVETIVDRTTQDQWWLSANDKYGLMGSIFVDGIDAPDSIHFANWKRLSNAKFKMEYLPGRNFNSLPFSIRDSAVCYYLDIRPLERWQNHQFTILLAAEDQYGFDVKKNIGGVVYETIINTPEARIDIIDPSTGARTSVSAGVPAGPLMPGQTVPKQDAVPTNIIPQLSSTAQAVVPAVVPPAVVETARPQSVRGSILLPIGPIRVDLMTLRELIYKVDEHIYFGTPVTEEELRGMEMTIGKLRSKYGGIFSPY
jgi:hypothetical protein